MQENSCRTNKRPGLWLQATTDQVHLSSFPQAGLTCKSNRMTEENQAVGLEPDLLFTNGLKL